MDIILDTNILRNDFQLHSNYFKVIFDYLEKTNGKVIIPKVVFDEIVSLHRKELETRSSKMHNTIRHLNLVVHDESQKLSIPHIDIDAHSLLFIQHLRTSLFLSDNQIIPAKNEYLPVVLDRAIKNIRPFRGHDQGFRDTIIWLTLKDYCQGRMEKQIIFLTGNTQDFSDPENPNQLHEDLLKDCQEAKIKVHFFKSISEFINKHSTLIEFITEDWILDKLGGYDLQAVFEEALYEYDKNFLTNWARERRVYVKETDYSIKYVEDYNIVDFSVYELEEFEYIINVGLKFIAGVQFDWYDELPYSPLGYIGGTETESFRFNSEISMRVKNEEISDLGFTYLHSR
jgi:hypothetical protein